MEQLRAVRAEGCTQVQGFLLGRPKPASLIPALLGAFADVHDAPHNPESAAA
jgi:EAL domain-containing protein (putative c-di-GMP-specific phosphodiesterase class I)